MKLYDALSEADIAMYYVQSKGSIDYLPNSAQGLVADGERYLQLHGMQHRLDETASIASEAYRIVQQVREQQALTQGQDNQFQVQQGHGDQRPSELDLAQQVQQQPRCTVSDESTSPRRCRRWSAENPDILGRSQQWPSPPFSPLVPDHLHAWAGGSARLEWAGSRRRRSRTP